VGEIVDTTSRLLSKAISLGIKIGMWILIGFYLVATNINIVVFVMQFTTNE